MRVEGVGGGVGARWGLSGGGKKCSKLSGVQLPIRPLLFIRSVVQRLRTLSERASETVVTVTVTKLTATRTPTKAPAATCLQKRR